MRRLLPLLLVAACGDDGVTPLVDARPPGVDSNLLPPDAGAPDAAPPDAGPPAAPQRTVTTIAGYGRHDGPLADAWLGAPQQLIFLPDGDMLFFDGGYNAIRKVDDATGEVTTVVGSWVHGYKEGPGREAQLAGVYGGELTLGPDGLIYFSDFANQRLRVWNPTNEVKTACGGQVVAPDHTALLAGTGEPGIDPDGMPAIDSRLDFPRGLTFWRGDLVIALVHNQRIRRLVCATGVFDTIAGNGNYGFAEDDGSVTVLDENFDTIGSQADFGDGGPATEALVNQPVAVAVAPDGALILAEWGQSATAGEYGRLRRVGLDGVITTVLGTPRASFGDDDDPTQAGLGGNPRGIAFDAAGNMFVADGGNGALRRVDAATGDSWGKVTTIMGGRFESYGYSAGDVGGPAAGAHLNEAASVAFKRDRLYYSDPGAATIRSLAPGADGVGPDSLVSDFSGSGGLRVPYGMGIDHANQIFLTPNSEGRILQVDRATGDVTTLLNRANVLAPAAGGLEAFATASLVMDSVGFDEDGNLYFVEFGHGQLMRIAASGGRITPNGRVSKIADIPAFISDHVAAGGGKVYVSAPDDGKIFVVTLATGEVTSLTTNEERDGGGDGLPLAQAGLVFPEGLALDVEDQVLWVADTAAGVWRLDLTGGMTRVVEIPTAYENCSDCTAPDRLAPGSGYVFVADRAFERILRLDTDDLSVETILGPSQIFGPGFVADEVPATEVELRPDAIAVGADGLLYVAESYVNRVRRIGGLDILGGGRVNRISLGSADPVRAAFLSSYAFDATTIDPATATLAGAPAVANSREDVDGDGRMDLVISVRPTEMRHARRGQKELTAEARTTGGRRVVETDYVVLTD